MPTIEELKKLKYTILRSSGIGTFIGILPAEGSTVAAIMGYNEATGDTINLNYKNANLNTLKIVGDARGIFYPEKGQTKIDSILNYIENGLCMCCIKNI